ncbi:hypothetical protein CV_0301 [Chromobacterium violaceum ATCC 12472]|uniref:Uncharacterized protein n=1 Tax=Chromobacterium violaceum (strain ATCC 12472 / DSM 30191 / JCM 1249 / CCUG 213 / NBRC 12614 / NCIMB 9131 / NCTC 9757 / MK) TaxID=243365 RepID=Q7P1B2_CHRVO|nr:hypothetical protein CV_0301 [Chromobacterium violaceum ATCC 12472]
MAPAGQRGGVGRRVVAVRHRRSGRTFADGQQGGGAGIGVLAVRAQDARRAGLVADPDRRRRGGSGEGRAERGVAGQAQLQPAAAVGRAGQRPVALAAPGLGIGFTERGGELSGLDVARPRLPQHHVEEGVRVLAVVDAGGVGARLGQFAAAVHRDVGRNRLRQVFRIGRVRQRRAAHQPDPRRHAEAQADVRQRAVGVVEGHGQRAPGLAAGGGPVERRLGVGEGVAVYRRQIALRIALAPVEQRFQLALAGQPPVVVAAQLLLVDCVDVGDGQAVFLSRLALRRLFGFAAGAGVVAVQAAAQPGFRLHFPAESGLAVIHAAGGLAGREGMAVGCAAGLEAGGALGIERGQAQLQMGLGVFGADQAAADAEPVEQGLGVVDVGQLFRLPETGGVGRIDLDAVGRVVVLVQRQQQAGDLQRGGIAGVSRAGQAERRQHLGARGGADFQLADPEGDGFASLVQEFAGGGGLAGAGRRFVIQAADGAVDEAAG